MNILNIPRRRKTDKTPQRELYLQEMCNRQDEEINHLRAENARLRQRLSTLTTLAHYTEQARLAEAPTRPAGLQL